MNFYSEINKFVSEVTKEIDAIKEKPVGIEEMKSMAKLMLPTKENLNLTFAQLSDKLVSNPNLTKGQTPNTSTSSTSPSVAQK